MYYQQFEDLLIRDSKSDLGMESFYLSSVRSNRAVHFSDFDGDHMTVTVCGDISISRNVYLYTQAGELKDIFTRIAEKSVKSWEGCDRFETLEGEFSIAASCTARGHVIFKFRITEIVGSDEDWEINFGIVSELGQMEKYSRRAVKFFACIR